MWVLLGLCIKVYEPVSMEPPVIVTGDRLRVEH